MGEKKYCPALRLKICYPATLTSATTAGDGWAGVRIPTPRQRSTGKASAGCRGRKGESRLRCGGLCICCR
ncbi:MAG: hypothetical protein LBC84_02390 [Prevotellaceae bacterium]|nr:hypothetical protein [Prevotellaceae bacterium]